MHMNVYDIVLHNQKGRNNPHISTSDQTSYVIPPNTMELLPRNKIKGTTGL